MTTKMTTAAPALTREEELHWLALKMAPGLGTRRAGKLLETFRSPQAVFRASRADLEAAGLSGGIAQSLASGCSFDDAVEQQQKMLECGASLIPFNDPRYPGRLKEIFDPPIVLFARGRMELLGTICLGIVGTRRATPYGMAATERLASDLAQAQLTIVSGMARGIDTAAHKAVLAVSGATIAVLGCGVDLVYPSENRKLASELIEKGLMISEFPMAAPPYPQNFPVRNRIISGMSAGILVVEGAQYSGSSITAKLAMDQGREVFAVPGNITSKMSWGPNLLLKQGAKLVQEWNDVIAELDPLDRRRLIVAGQRQLGVAALEEGAEGTAQEPNSPFSEGPQAVVLKALMGSLTVDSAIHLDALLETLEYHSSSELIAGLFELEMLGMVKQLPGKNFVKVW
jgi:DNA processing protein